MLRKRKALGWMKEAWPVADLAKANKVLETGLQPMDLELDASETASSLVVQFEDQEAFQDLVKNCRFVRDPLYNDRFLVDREIAYNLLSAVVHRSR